MNIKKFAEITGMSPHTIRYYEKIGIFRDVSRNASGHRSFRDKDIIWAEFIKRLKDTGMPLDKILEYADLREKGDYTAGSRMAILKNHAALLEKRLSVEKSNLKKLRGKIKYYEELLKE
jgi:DNA-binding transcriptional MerR regulator